MAGVVQFRKKAQIARRRSRAEALGVIIPRLKELRARADRRQVVGRGSASGGAAKQRLVETATVGRLTLFYFDNEEGTYFSVSIEGERQRVMTGQYNCGGRLYIVDGELVVEGNRYLADVHIASWKRGDWEAELFAS